MGDHSTSDNSATYRDENELKSWVTQNNPIQRLGLFLEKQIGRKFGGKEDEELRGKIKEETITELKKSALEKYSAVEELFEDVYDVKTRNLEEQEKELKEHLKSYGEHYHLEKFKN